MGARASTYEFWGDINVYNTYTIYKNIEKLNIKNRLSFAYQANTRHNKAGEWGPEN